jgi:hypothetical protein
MSFDKQVTDACGGDEKRGQKESCPEARRFSGQKSFRALETPPVVTPAKGKSFDCSIQRGGWKGKSMSASRSYGRAPKSKARKAKNHWIRYEEIINQYAAILPGSVRFIPIYDVI